MDERDTYLSFAENDYLFLADAYKLGLRGSMMAAGGQNICGRYLKHLISIYAAPDSEKEMYEKENVLKTHSLAKLIRYIKNDMGLSVPEEAETSMYRIDGFYFTTRYPGDNCFHPDERDAEAAMDAVWKVRVFTYSVINDLSCDKDGEKFLTEENPCGTEAPDF